MANLLYKEDSPYLQQHKDNPVHWMPWCDEAFIKAKSENRPIFISIGYSSCHWCHVMEHEVFENKALAEKLNKSFVCIKVDREERPDIDKFYQEVHMLLNRRAGGWPTSIFSTPENKPFFAGTYIPPQTQQNMMGFGDLIDIISLKVAEKDQALFNNVQEIQTYLQPSSRPTQAARLTESIISKFMQQCENNFDKNFGGFGHSPKFPQVSTLKSLLDISLIANDDKALHMFYHSLDSMVSGGIYDLVQGGFCRYSTDENWLVPHFEKMTYDNGLLIELYVNAYKASKNIKYLNIAQDTAHFMIKRMSQDNLFFSASDADSDGVEGKYFVYDYEETLSYFQEHGFSEDDAQEICSHLHITPFGNFEGSSIIRLDTHKPKGYDKAIKLLNQIRDEREYPFIDKKINTCWNAMMIKSLFLLANYDKSFLSPAISHLSALLEKLYKDEHLYHTAMIDSQAKVNAFLEDYAYLSTALIQAYQTTLDSQYLQLCQKLVDKALKEFFEAGKWYFSKGEFITDADIGDSSYAGSVGVMVDVLLSLGILLDEKYRQLAFMSLEYHSASLIKSPIRYPYLFNQALRYIKEDRIIKATKEAHDDMSKDYFEISYPFILRTLSSENETLLCGIQSCYTNLDKDADLNKAIQKTL